MKETFSHRCHCHQNQNLTTKKIMFRGTIELCLELFSKLKNKFEKFFFIELLLLLLLC